MKIVLYPLSLAYGLVLAARNACFDLGIFKQHTFAVPVISVGNITVGGTGKTPMVEFIIRNLGARYKIATLSRGYGRETRGVIIASPSDSPRAIGDEPYQVLSKFGDVTVAVAEKRVEGIQALLSHERVPDLILLDDAFQHRHVKPGLSILLVDFNRPTWDDTPFPGGRLREFARGSCRAHIVVVTKCPPTLSQQQRDTFTSKIQGAKLETTFFASIEYGKPVELATGHERADLLEASQEIVLLTGIAQPRPLVDYLAGRTRIARHFSFNDHHDFTSDEIGQVLAFCNSRGLPLVTTEKDAVRLRESLRETAPANTFVLPIETTFVDGREKEFIYQLYKYLANA